MHGPLHPRGRPGRRAYGKVLDWKWSDRDTNRYPCGMLVSPQRRPPKLLSSGETECAGSWAHGSSPRPAQPGPAAPSRQPCLSQPKLGLTPPNSRARDARQPAGEQPHGKLRRPDPRRRVRAGLPGGTRGSCRLLGPRHPQGSQHCHPGSALRAWPSPTCCRYLGNEPMRGTLCFCLLNKKKRKKKKEKQSYRATVLRSEDCANVLNLKKDKLCFH